jgi:hypothetical protein
VKPEHASAALRPLAVWAVAPGGTRIFAAGIGARLCEAAVLGPAVRRGAPSLGQGRGRRGRRAALGRRDWTGTSARQLLLDMTCALAVPRAPHLRERA